MDDGGSMTDTSNGIPAESNVLTRLCDGIAHACLVIAALSLMCIVAINGANVVMRYVFRSSFSWAEELMLFLMILGVFSGAIAVTWRNLHIRIDTLVDRLAPATRRVMQVLASLASIVVVGIVTVASFRLVSLLQSMDQRSDALNAPSWIPQSFVTIGLGMIAVMIAVRLVLSFRR
jgi:TRAP-type C4-dicarboxylate transport system permease small subunit